MKHQQYPYQDYLKSSLWRSRHKQWLKRTHNRCQLFPWLRVGVVRGRYHPYAIHHMHINSYNRLGKEIWNRDVLVLSPLAHEFVFHWLVSGGKRKVRYQKDFPNLAQRVLNWWCRTVGLLLLFPGWVITLIACSTVLIVTLCRV